MSAMLIVLRSFLAIALLLAAIPARAATFVIDAVGDAGDNNPGDGVCDSVLAGVDCTLRASIQEANGLPGRDRIEIPTLAIGLSIVGADDMAAVGDLDVTEAVDIVGIGFAPAISQLADEHIFEFHGVDGSLSNLLLQEGDTAIRATGGHLELVDLEITSGVGAGVAVDSAGSINVRGVDIDRRSTGLYAGEVSIVDRVSIRRAGRGITLERGGVISNTRVYDANAGPPASGAIAVTARGDVVVQNVSLYRNCGFCAPFGSGHVDLWIENGTARLRNSLIQGKAFSSTFVMSCGMGTGGSIVSEGGNTGPSSSVCNLTDGTDSNLQVSFVDSVGTPSGTHAIDSAISGTCPHVDLYGLARPTGDGCDRGAVEVDAAVACENGLDDDGDGFVDLQDPGCRDAADPVETHLRTGDFAVVNWDASALLALDATTGRAAPISRGAGLFNGFDVALDPSGSVLVADFGLGTLTQVEPDAGTVGLVSVAGNLVTPNGVAIASASEILVSDSTNDTIVSVDPTTGVQSLLTISPDPDFPAIDDLMIDPTDGSLLISDLVEGLYRISDPLGAFTVNPITGPTVLTRPRQMAFDLSGDLVVADEAVDAPVRVDPGTGIDTQMLTTTPFSFMWGSAVEPSGLALFTDYDTGLISRVDEAGDTYTPINSGHADPGLGHIEAVSSDHELTVSLTDALVIDGGSPGVVDIGDTIELTAVVTNMGAGTADLLSFESGLDPALTLVASSLSTTQGSIVEGSLASDPRLEVDLGSLAPAATATLTWQVDVGDPAPHRSVSTNAWVRREQIILAESDDPTTGPANDSNVVGVGDYGVVVQAMQKISDTRGLLSGAGNPGSVLLDSGVLGDSLEPLGDIDGDGVEDVAVGSSTDSEAGTNYGAFSILLLNTDGTVKQRHKWHASSPDLAVALSTAGLSLSDDRFGASIAYLGDLDGAGPSDFALAVGAWYDDGLGAERGAFYVIFMDQSPLQVLSLTKIGDGVGGFPSGQLSDFGVESVL